MENHNQAIDRERLVETFFSKTGSSYDEVVSIFTLGLDSYWKREIIQRVPSSRRILDLGCGTGILTEYLASNNPDATIVGVDITEDYLAEYSERLRKKTWIRAEPILSNAETVKLDGQFDAVASSYLAKYVDPDVLLDNIAPHIKRGGIFVAHDFTLPRNRIYLYAWERYVQLMDYFGLKFFPEWRNVFSAGLKDLIEQTKWYTTYPEVLRRHGFEAVYSKYLSFQCAGIVWGTKA